MRDEFIYLLSNVNGAVLGIWEWTRYLIPYVTEDWLLAFGGIQVNW